MRKFIYYIVLTKISQSLLKQLLLRVSPSLAYYELLKDVCYLVTDIVIAAYTIDSEDRTTADFSPVESQSNLKQKYYDKNKPQR